MISFSPSPKLSVLSSLNIVGRVVRIFVSGLNISPDDSKAFLHDFKAGNSKEAQDILNARKKEYRLSLNMSDSWYVTILCLLNRLTLGCRR